MANLHIPASPCACAQLLASVRGCRAVCVGAEDEARTVDDEDVDLGGAGGEAPEDEDVDVGGVAASAADAAAAPPAAASPGGVSLAERRRRAKALKAEQKAQQKAMLMAQAEFMRRQGMSLSGRATKKTTTYDPRKDGLSDKERMERGFVGEEVKKSKAANAAKQKAAAEQVALAANDEEAALVAAAVSAFMATPRAPLQSLSEQDFAADLEKYWKLSIPPGKLRYWKSGLKRAALDGVAVDLFGIYRAVCSLGGMEACRGAEDFDRILSCSINGVDMARRGRELTGLPNRIRTYWKSYLAGYYGARSADASVRFDMGALKADAEARAQAAGLLEGGSKGGGVTVSLPGSLAGSASGGPGSMAGGVGLGGVVGINSAGSSAYQGASADEGAENLLGAPSTRFPGGDGTGLEGDVAMAFAGVDVDMVNGPASDEDLEMEVAPTLAAAVKLGGAPPAAPAALSAAPDRFNARWWMGRRVEVWWPGEGEWFGGIITEPPMKSFEKEGISPGERTKKVWVAYHAETEEDDGFVDIVSEASSLRLEGEAGYLTATSSKNMVATSL